ncbi:3345_t:CDS:2, partial [Gigaspora margarita]
FVLTEEVNCTKCTDYSWTIKNPVTATIKFDNRKIKGSFSLYDNMKDSGTQISGSFARGMKLNKPHLYKFTAHIYSTCDKIHKNEFFTFDVSNSFLPRKVKAIKSNKFGPFKTSSHSWYFGPSVPTAVVAYQRSSPKSQTWKFKACANLVMKDKKKIKNFRKKNFKKIEEIKKIKQAKAIKAKKAKNQSISYNNNNIIKTESSLKVLQHVDSFYSSKIDTKKYVDVEIITDDFKIY